MIQYTLGHPPGWWVAACWGLGISTLVLYAVALVGLIVLGQGSGDGRARFSPEALSASGAPAGCVLEDDGVLADAGYLPASMLSCWDSAWNLTVVSPERTR
jgi:hypothetical protein